MQGTIRLRVRWSNETATEDADIRADHPDVPAETISAQPDLESSLHIDSHLG